MGGAGLGAYLRGDAGRKQQKQGQQASADKQIAPYPDEPDAVPQTNVAGKSLFALQFPQHPAGAKPLT